MIKKGFNMITTEVYIKSGTWPPLLFGFRTWCVGLNVLYNIRFEYFQTYPNKISSIGVVHVFISEMIGSCLHHSVFWNVFDKIEGTKANFDKNFQMQITNSLESDTLIMCSELLERNCSAKAGEKKMQTFIHLSVHSWELV